MSEKFLLYKISDRFICCEAGYNDSGIVLFGAPFDGTASYKPGARFAGACVRGASGSIETYSPYLDMDLLDPDVAVYDAGDLELPFGAAGRAIDIIRNHVSAILEASKIPFMVGGEHLVTLGAVQAAAAKYPELSIIQFDAHADLRDSYIGEKLSHAAVMRRCHDITGDGRIYQFGVRSGEREEFDFAKTHTRLQRFNFDGLAETLTSPGLDKKPVYLTIDLDVLDPSEMPGTGTPEAGGVRFMELLEAANAVISSARVVGLDVTELCPPADPGGISVSLTCKLIRELLLLISRAAAQRGK